MKQAHIGFVQGVGWAIAFLVGTHRELSLGEQLAGESGISKYQFKKYCDKADWVYIKEVVK